MAFKKGNKLASGGKREGAGRKPDDFKSVLGRAIDENDILGTVIKMASGDLEVSDKVRLSAATWLLEMRNGKAPQSVQVGGPDGGPISIRMVNYT